MRTILLGLILVVTVRLSAQEKYQPMNVKAGLWEVSRTVTTSGDVPIPADMLSKMSAAQRARVEENMKAMSSGRTIPENYKSCVTRDDVEKGPAFNDEQMRSCTQSIVNSTTSKAELRLTCEEEGIHADGTLQVQALNPEQVKGSSHITATGNGRTMNSDSSFTAKWIGPNCGSTE